MAIPPKIEHRIGVQTPPEVIWEIVSDLSRWHRWNPLYPKAEGVLRIGSKLTLEEALPGEPPRVIQPTILDWVPNEQIHWKMVSKRGFLKSIHYIEIEQLSEASCIFSNGEIFDGLLAAGTVRRMRGKLRAGFTAMGERVKALAEETWRARQETTT